MKSSCLSLSSPHEPASPTLPHHIPDDTYKHSNIRTTDLGNKGPKFQTIIQVLRCELARPGRPVQNSTVSPSKHWTPVHHAAFHDREAALVHFLQKGHSPDGSASIDSPLCVAVAAGHIGAVRILLEAGADVNRSTHESRETPLHLVIKSARSDMFDELLACGPDLAAQTEPTKETALHYAAGNAGSLAVIVSLLKSGANYEMLNAQGCSAAEVAIKSGNIHGAVAIISAARGNRKKLAKEKEMLLRHVENAQNRFSLKNELIADLFEASIDPDSTALVEAIKRDDLSLAKLFLERGADPNRPTQSGLRPIYAALDCSGAKMVQLLVGQDLDVTIRDSDGHTVLQAVLESPSAHDKEAALGIFEALLSKGAEADTHYPDGKTLLHHVVAGLGLSRVVPLLLQQGLDVNATDNTGCTALHLASQSKSCIETLIKHGADVTFTNHIGQTPLVSALNAITKDSETDLDALIKKSDLRTVDTEHRTALHIACERGLERTVRALLKHRAETTIIDSQARTPLILAIINQQWNLVPLLATQPGVNTWDKEGMTALHHAVRTIPVAPSTWKEVAITVRRFCERGASRSMRDKSGATPLIRAVTSLPEEGLPVIEVLLADTTGGRGNCVDHEDHKQKSALYFAATLGKPSFVRALLKNGASFVFKEWTPTNGPLRPNTSTDKQTLKHLAESEWMRRAALLQRKSGEPGATPVLPKVLPIRDLKELLSMGLDPNVLPFPSKSTYSGLLLWLVLNQTLIPPPLPPKYLYDVFKLILTHGADANATAVRTSNGARSSTQSLAKLPLGCHPLAFLLEQYPTVDIDLILLFLDNGSNLTTPSPFYDGRYPLHSAVKANRLDIVDEFLVRRTDVDVRDKDARSPLFIAAEQGLWEIADLLLQKRAKIDTKDSEGGTALHAAARGGSAKIVSSLLRAGAKALVMNHKEVKARALVPDDLEDREKNKIINLLKNAEENERRDEEWKADRLKREAIEEGKRKRQKEMEQQQLQKQVDFMSARKPSPPQKPTLTNMKTPSSSFLSLALKPRPSPTISPSMSSPALPTPTSPPVKQQAKPIEKSTLKVEKPLPQPRIDSGFGFAQKKDESTEKPLPALDRTKQTFDVNGSESPAKEDTSELMSWLAVSKALDRL